MTSPKGSKFRTPFHSPSPGFAPCCRACSAARAGAGRPMAQRSLQGKSMFGSQTLSNRSTAPSHGFGSGTRSHAAKLFAGSEHAKTSSVSCTPGPCYEISSSMGTQSDGGKQSPAMWQFGTADRFNGSPRKRSPGPGSYENAGAFGKQGLSNRSTFPRYGFGTVDRDMASKARCAPAPARGRCRSWSRRSHRFARLLSPHRSSSRQRTRPRRTARRRPAPPPCTTRKAWPQVPSTASAPTSVSTASRARSAAARAIE